MKAFLLIFVISALGDVAKAAEPFGVMTCKKVISDEIYLSTKSDRVSVKWITRGGDSVVTLLRALADKQIPTSLLGAYGEVRIEFALPLSSCEIKGTGKFSCDHVGGSGEAIRLRVSAKVSPYEGDEPDIYEGELSRVTIKSRLFGKKDARHLEFPMQFEVESPTKASLKTKSNFFFAHYWDYDGFNQNPSCLVDNVFLVD